MKLLMENWRKYLAEVEKIDLPAGEPYRDNWEDPPVAVSDADIESDSNSNNAHLFVLLMDKLGEFFKVPEPVITSAYRGAERQLRAILGIWSRDIVKGPLAGRNGKREALEGLKGQDNGGSKYIMDMYKDCEAKQACMPGAAEVAKALVDIWENGQDGAEGNAVNRQAYQDSIEVIEANGGLSMHQSGDSVDYGLKSNSGAVHIKDMIDFILENNLADLHLIDERGGAGPHWHVTVFKITPEGIRFLETPNDQWEPQ